MATSADGKAASATRWQRQRLPENCHDGEALHKIGLGELFHEQVVAGGKLPGSQNL
jgi:hypothetical protein